MRRMERGVENGERSLEALGALLDFVVHGFFHTREPTAQPMRKAIVVQKQLPIPIAIPAIISSSPVF